MVNFMRVMVTAGLFLSLVAPAALSQQIWLGPRIPDSKITAVTDWDLMFKPDPQWQQLAGQIQVFLATAGFLNITPDDQLQTMEATLKSHHIALAVPLQPIARKPGDTCGHQEGYTDLGFGPKVIAKLKRLGIQIQIIRLDGPLWFGAYDKGGCQLAVPDIASRVSETLQPYLEAFPKVVVGDVEPPQSLAQFPGWEDKYLTLKQDLEPLIGRKISFLHMDVRWREGDWARLLPQVAQFAHQSGMKFGVIYDSDDDAISNEDWVARAKDSYDELETRYHLIPNQSVFQTWNKWPRQVFPESTPSSHSWLVAQYLLPRTQLVAAKSPSGVQGTLSTRIDHKPVAGAKVTVEALSIDPKDPPPVHSLSGVVPSDARYGILNMHVNNQCLCSGNNDLLFGPLAYQETSGGKQSYLYAYAPPAHPNGFMANSLVIAGQPLVHVRVSLTQVFGFNSSIFTVTPGAQFQFQVPIGSLNGQGLFGAATVIWLNGAQKGFKTSDITVNNHDAAPLAEGTTDASGHFTVSLPDDLHGQKRLLRVYYPGSSTSRAAYAVPQ